MRHSPLHPVLVLLGLAAPLMACSGLPPSVASGPNASETPDSCRTQRAELDAAGRLPPPSADDSIAGVTRSIDGLAEAVDRVAAAYGALESCRFAEAEAIRTAAVAGSLSVSVANTRIAAVGAQFERDLTASLAVSDQIQDRAGVILRTADRLIAAAPDSAGSVSLAVAAPQVPGRAFLTLEPAQIHLRPDGGSPVVAEMRKGLRVDSTGSGDDGPWLRISLNDGTLGWVERVHLRPVPANASSLRTAARAMAAQASAADPVVALGLAARRTLPREDDALARRLAGAREAAGLSFAPIPETGVESIASAAVAP